VLDAGERFDFEMALLRVTIKFILEHEAEDIKLLTHRRLEFN